VVGPVVLTVEAVEVAAEQAGEERDGQGSVLLQRVARHHAPTYEHPEFIREAADTDVYSLRCELLGGRCEACLPCLVGTGSRPVGVNSVADGDGKQDADQVPAHNWTDPQHRAHSAA
jgi:hypothetical protein